MLGNDLRNTLAESLRGWNSGSSSSIEDDINLKSLVNEGQGDSVVRRTFIGRPSTRRPLRASTAFDAPSDRWKMMVAMPRLTPPGPYEISTLLIGPTDLMKYSYFPGPR